MATNSFLYFVFVASLLVDLHQPAFLTEKTFTKVTNSGLGSDRLGPGWTADSFADCGLQCLVKYSSRCQTFMYNSNTRLCTPGSFLRSGMLGAALVPIIKEGALYAQSACDTSDGFSLLVSGTLSACALVSNFSTTYYGAHDYCLSLGAHLYVSRSVERFNMLPHGEIFTIGLTDLATEGTFVWQDNGDAITPAFRSVLFSPNEPSNAGGIEHCVVVLPGTTSHIANDYRCPRFFKFVCERPWFY